MCCLRPHEHRAWPESRGLPATCSTSPPPQRMGQAHVGLPQFWPFFSTFTLGEVWQLEGGRGLLTQAVHAAHHATGVRHRAGLHPMVVCNAWGQETAPGQGRLTQQGEKNMGTRAEAASKNLNYQLLEVFLLSKYLLLVLENSIVLNGV